MRTWPRPAMALRTVISRSPYPALSHELDRSMQGRAHRAAPAWKKETRGPYDWPAVMAPAIRLTSAVALLGRFPALAGVDLDVASGEVVLLRGQNGAGKTTLLRACAGLVAVSSGTAVVLGHDLRRDRRQVRRHVALLGHGTALYDDLDVAANLRFWTRAAGRPAAA